MSALEGATRPIMAPLVLDIAIPLDALQQWTMALWAVKTAMVMESVTARERPYFYTQDERHRLRTSSALPLNTSVWLGRHFGGPLLQHWGTNVRDGIPEAPTTIKGFVNTLAFHRLAIQVITVRIPSVYRDTPINIQPKPGPWDRLLIPISPAERKVDWPPSLSIDDTTAFDFQAVHERWSLINEFPID